MIRNPVVFVILRNGKPIIETLWGAAAHKFLRLAWCRAREKERHVQWWRSRFPRSRIEAVPVYASSANGGAA